MAPQPPGVTPPGPYPTVKERDVLVHILVELRVQSRVMADEFGRRDELLSLRADEENAIGWTTPALTQKDS